MSHLTLVSMSSLHLCFLVCKDNNGVCRTQRSWESMSQNMLRDIDYY